MSESPWDVDIDMLVLDRQAFSDFVYTPLQEAMSELTRRWNDPTIETYPFVPPPLKDGFRAIHYVSVITPNQQIKCYIEMAKKIGLEPLIFEQTKDKFTSNNEWKASLGKLHFFIGRDKNNDSRIEFLNIIDFNQSNGKRISSVRTLWQESLIHFHHELFFKKFPQFNEADHIFEGSDWFAEHGGNPQAYYRAFLSLLIKHAIQFENFMVDEKEMSFTKEVFLPAFIEVYKKTGLKPLIVALEPIETEGDRYWLSYPCEEMEFVVDKLHMSPHYNSLDLIH